MLRSLLVLSSGYELGERLNINKDCQNFHTCVTKAPISTTISSLFQLYISALLMISEEEKKTESDTYHIPKLTEENYCAWAQQLK